VSHTEMRLFYSLLADLRRNAELSPWHKAQGAALLASEVRDEAEELVQAFGMNEPIENILAELGDVLSDTLLTAIHLESEGTPRAVEMVIRSCIEKLRRRKPWLFDGSKIPDSVEEELKIWHDAKAKEKEHELQTKVR
jgi:XTP/dITP diphosphohydrolase